MKIALIVLALSATTLAWIAPAPVDDERAAVERACLDYVEGLYLTKPELIERSVHPDLRKIGFGRSDEHKEYRAFPMTFEELRALAAEWNEDGSHASAESPRKIQILDVLDQTASAKLTAEWGIDYFHLAKFEGQWKIINVLWQTHPPTTEAALQGK